MTNLSNENGASPISYFPRNEDDLVFLSVPAAGMLGAIIGLELSGSSSSTGPRAEPRRRPEPGLLLAPVVAPAPRGGFMGGLSGSF